ncbi:NAD(P)/FAD-dependent oxidoreductase [Alteribacter natronophilus]|uniref:NAD(P)/FAD-dependent oxidoreductase n=1 Tax=Alteribacter natronophilus TaxID=2583810 RepID=UPI00110DB94D|nr:FAD-dependent oxidoreductase [Alteribacter natronophilus]TMW71473.1 FAD-dependent oxidoreductase [Alteribacter natronophilus]
MELHSGSLYWPTTLKQYPEYPKLDQPAECDVLIIGGGEAGAQMAHRLSLYNIDTILVEKNTVAGGSSSANTGLLQFANDKMLTSFAKKLGEDKAVKFYKRCLKAIDDLEVYTRNLEFSSDFIRRKSLFYASSRSDVKKLLKEYEMLRKHRFPVSLLQPHEISTFFPFEKDLAILSDLDAEINPFKLVVALIREAHKNGVRVYENTEVLGHEFAKDSGGTHTFRTPKGTIEAKHVIYCTGYATAEFANIKKAVNNRSYAIVTQPVKDLSSWHERVLIWETKQPYLYMRTTPDNRIVAGGLDEQIKDPTDDPGVLREKGDELLRLVREHFPVIPDLAIAHEWSATFGESRDGLPFMGNHPKHENVFFLLGYGGNGSVYCTIGADIIKDLILYGYSPDSALTALDR